jgi:hypothetical protein
MTPVLTDRGKRGGPSHNQIKADSGIQKLIQSGRIPPKEGLDKLFNKLDSKKPIPNDFLQ